MGSAPDNSPESRPAGTPAVAPLAARRKAPMERDRIAGFSILFTAFSAALIVSWKASEAVRPNVAAEPAPPTSEGIAGFPEHVDPIAMLARARGLTGRDQLRRITMAQVGSDGTVDLRQPHANIRFEFDSAAGEGPDAPRPVGTVRPVHYCGRQAVQIRSEGIQAEADQPKSLCRPSAGEALPAPRCGPRELWAVARQRGAAADGRATIEYYRSHEGPAWRFSLPNPHLQFTMYGDCEHELEGDTGRPL